MFQVRLARYKSNMSGAAVKSAIWIGKQKEFHRKLQICTRIIGDDTAWWMKGWVGRFTWKLSQSRTQLTQIRVAEQYNLVICCLHFMKPTGGCGITVAEVVCVWLVLGKFHIFQLYVFYKMSMFEDWEFLTFPSRMYQLECPL